MTDTYFEQTDNSNECLGILEALSRIYYFVYYIDLNQMDYHCVKSSGIYHELIPNTGDVNELITMLLKSLPEEYYEVMLDFSNLESLKERLKHDSSTFCEHKTVENVWVKTKFTVISRGEDDLPKNVVLTAEIIEDERKVIIESERSAKSNKEIISALKDLYLAVHSIDLSTMMFETLHSPGYLVEAISKKDNVNNVVSNWINTCVSADSIPQALAFCDLTTLQERLKDTDKITVDLNTLNAGRVRETLCVTKRDYTGTAKRLLWFAQQI